MHILNVCPNLHPVFGAGSAERALQMSRTLTGEGIEVTLLNVNLGAERCLATEAPGVRVETLRCCSRRFRIPAAAPRRIATLVKRADMIHLMGHWSLLNALVYRHARARGIPYVVCPAGALPIFGRSMRLKRAFNRVVGTSIVRDAARVIAITEDEIQQALAYGVDAGAVRVIPNGVDLSAYRHRDDEGFRQRFELGDAPFVLFMGRLHAIKGPDLLIEAFAALSEQFPSHRLILAGPDDGMLDHLRAVTAKHGLRDRVRFIGHIAGETKSAAYHAAELLVIPSRQEAMSMVVLESGAAGTPVVATDKCGLNNLASIGAGIVVAATADGIAAGVAEALSEPARLRAMGEKLRAHTASTYAWNVVSAQLVALFDEVVEARRVGGVTRRPGLPLRTSG